MVAAFLLVLAFQSIDGWTFWSRDEGAGKIAKDDNAIRIEHTGKQDWSLAKGATMDVQPEDIVQITCHMRKDGKGSAGPCFIAYRADGSVKDWSLGYVEVSNTTDKLVKALAIVPRDVVKLAPRVIGWGPSTAWVADFKVLKTGTLSQLRPKDLQSTIDLDSPKLKVIFNTKDATFEIYDKRIKQSWTQKPVDTPMIVLKADDGPKATIELLEPRSMQRFTLTAGFDITGTELVCNLHGEGALPRSIAYPEPFVGKKGDDLIVPMNEGITCPVNDPDFPEQWLVGYGGHGICMSFFGVTRGKTGLMTLVETPDDFLLKMQRRDKLMENRMEWQSQKGQFGYDRKWRWIAFDQGGYVAMTKKYRLYAKAQGKLVTLAEKRKKVPAIDLLVGAPNLWAFGGDEKILSEFKAQGVQQLLWSAGGKPEFLEKVNAMGYLSSRYDIVQDVMDPAQYSNIQYTHPDWPKEAWPKDIVIREDGSWEKGWEIEAKNGGWVACGVVCDRQAIPYLDKRIADELKTHPYRCRFIDTTTAAPWRECYSLDHPMTRTDSRKYKMNLLKLMADKFKLVVGSETGHDEAVPYASYFEGMLSLGPFRVDDSGRHMEKTVDPAPPQITKYQVGEKYRLPLWELVYHDCLCSHWYWGDHQGKVPSVWDKKDLFNVLYGTAPMFLFNAGDWDKLKARIFQSCKTILPIARATGYSEMLSHRYLTPDRTVQQTRFADGTVVTVNFGKEAYLSIRPMSFLVSNINNRKSRLPHQQTLR